MLHRRGTRFTVLSLLTLVAVVAGNRSGHAQVSVYRGGDGTTTAQRGTEFCATDPINLNVADGVTYSVTSGSEFAYKTPVVLGGVPNPMGRNSPIGNGPYFGVAVVNPTDGDITITQVTIDGTVGAKLFKSVRAVKPATGWIRSTGARARWTGSAIVPKNSALDFVVRVEPDDENLSNVPIQLEAVTSAGTLTNAGNFNTATTKNDFTPAVNVYYVQGPTPAWVEASTNLGQVTTGTTKTFTLMVAESEPGNAQPIPVLSRLTIGIPPGWSGVTAAASADFTIDHITQPTACDPGEIVAIVAANILNRAAPFSFLARSPDTLRSTGLFLFDTAIFNPTTTPPIQARAMMAMEVTAPLSAGTRTGLTVPEAFAIIPHPMGRRNVGRFGAAFANPTGAALTVTEVRIRELSPTGGLFRSLLPLRPTTGWSRVSASELRWTGSVAVAPHTAIDFLTEVQGNEVSFAIPRTIEVTVTEASASYVNTDASIAETTGPYVSLTYIASGVPRGVLPGVLNGDAGHYLVEIEEREGGVVGAGSTLTIEIPPRWSSVAASPSQIGFAVPAIAQPTLTSPGSITVATNLPISRSSVRFAFEATAPSNVLQSLFVFPTTLQLPSETLVAIAQPVVQTLEIDDGGMVVRNVSPTVIDPVMTEFDVRVKLTSDPNFKPFALQIQNQTNWETLGIIAPSATSGTVTFPVRENLANYLDAANKIETRFASSGRECHNLHADLVQYVVSSYDLTGSSLAPLTAIPGATAIPMEHLRFHSDLGTVEIREIAMRGIGHDPRADITGVHLYRDGNCDALINGGDGEILAATLDGNALARLQDGSTLFVIDPATDACAIVAIDIAPVAASRRLVGLQIENPDQVVTLTADAPFPSTTGYPVYSQYTLILGLDTDNDGLPDTDEGSLCSSSRDADSDDDGLLDGVEQVLGTDLCGPDSDLDALPDGLEVGAPAIADPTDDDADGTPNSVDPAPADNTITGTSLASFIADADPATTTLPLDIDSDDDGLADGREETLIDGRADFTLGGTGSAGSGETDPSKLDTDGDGCQDGTEVGEFIGTVDTDSVVFQPDFDPGILTSPVDTDTDDDGLDDGAEDLNCDGALGAGETNPAVVDASNILRNSDSVDLTRKTPPLSSIFVVVGPVSLDERGGNGIPDIGDGDDDDMLDRAPSSPPWIDPDGLIIGDVSRPLIFYQLTDRSTPILLVKLGTDLAISW